VLLACVLLLLSAFVAASRCELYRAPVLVGPVGERYLVAGETGPLVAEPGFLLSWESKDGSWSPLERIRGRYESACFFQGLLYVFFDDGSYASYRRASYVERDLFPFDWAPASVVALGEEMLAFGGEGERVIRVAGFREGNWSEGPTLATKAKEVENVQATVTGAEVVVAWQEKPADDREPGGAVFISTYREGQWQPPQVLTLNQVRDYALGTGPDGEAVLITAEHDPERRGSWRLWEHRCRQGTWLEPRPVDLPVPRLTGRVLDFSVASDERGPLLVVSRASALECYQQRGQSWERVEVLATGGEPGGLGAGVWLLLSVAALVVLGSVGVLLFARVGVVRPTGLHSEIAYATIAERGAAFAFDFILVFLVVLLFSETYEPNTTAAITFVGHVAYATLLEAYWGRTLGKKLVGIVVVTVDLEAIGLGRSALRNVARVIDSIPAYLIGIVAVMLSRRRQRLGDRLAGTVVLRESSLLVPRVTTLSEEAPTGDAEAQV